MKTLVALLLGWWLLFYHDGQAWVLWPYQAWERFDRCHEQVERFNVARLAAVCVEFRTEP